jgi:hypothetical protein
VEEKHVALPQTLAAQAVPGAEAFPPLSLVRNTATLGREDIEGLATALLDLGSGYEAALRTVISMQRLLERVRRCEHVSPEATLLLQEMSRQMARLSEGSLTVTTELQEAQQRIQAMQGDPGD